MRKDFLLRLPHLVAVHKQLANLASEQQLGVAVVLDSSSVPCRLGRSVAEKDCVGCVSAVLGAVCTILDIVVSIGLHREELTRLLKGHFGSIQVAVGPIIEVRPLR